MFNKVIEEVYVDRSVETLAMCKSIIKRLEGSLPIEYYTKPDDLPTEKQVLVITKKQGSMVKPIPYDTGLSDRVAYLIYQTNCINNCVYCYLQDYIKTSAIYIYINYQDLLDQLKTSFGKYKVFYAGQLNDSLLFDYITDYTKILVPYFEGKSGLLELRTKTTNINNLLELKPHSQVVISFSLNPESIISLYEPNTAGLGERILAAKKCREWGYKIAFHIDPIILIKGWEIEYKSLIESLKTVGDIEYISLGVFRFSKSLAEIIKSKYSHPQREILYSEFFRGYDKKYRYFRPLRMGVYKYIISIIRDILGQVKIYLCMEPMSVRKNIAGLNYKD